MLGEHAGKPIGTYYYEIAYPRLSFPPDAVAAGNNAEIAQYNLEGARLTNISLGSVESRYMRFHDLGSSIISAEREQLGIPSFVSYPDLVVACPQTTKEDAFRIVSSELTDIVRQYRRVRIPMGKSKPPLAGEPDTSVRLYNNRYRDGLYRKIPHGLENIRAELPKTVEACLSVAQLIVEHEMNTSLLGESPGGNT